MQIPIRVSASSHAIVRFCPLTFSAPSYSDSFNKEFDAEKGMVIMRAEGKRQKNSLACQLWKILEHVKVEAVPFPEVCSIFYLLANMIKRWAIAYSIV